MRDSRHLTELDLYRLAGRSGWVAERARLSAEELSGLTAIIKHSIEPGKRHQCEFWLNQLFAEYVTDLRKRARSLEETTTEQRHRLPGGSPPKLSTLVSNELREICEAIRNSVLALEALSPAAQDALRVFYRRTGLCVRGPDMPGGTFREAWGRAFDDFQPLQASCERVGEEGPAVAQAVLEELARVTRALDRLTVTIEGVSGATRDVLEWSYDDLAMAETRSRESRAAGESLLAVEAARPWLQVLGSLAEHPRIEVKQGRDEAAARRLVCGLAEVYRAVNGKEPGRVFRAIETSRGEPAGEARDFLELVRGLAALAQSRLAAVPRAASLSLSKVVRQVLEERGDRQEK